MDPSTQNTFLAQVNEAQVWTGEYFVPDLNNDGKLVPVLEGIQMTKNKDGIRGIMPEVMCWWTDLPRQKQWKLRSPCVPVWKNSWDKKNRGWGKRKRVRWQNESKLLKAWNRVPGSYQRQMEPKGSCVCLVWVFVMCLLLELFLFFLMCDCCSCSHFVCENNSVLLEFAVQLETLVYAKSTSGRRMGGG